MRSLQQPSRFTSTLLVAGCFGLAASVARAAPQAAPPDRSAPPVTWRVPIHTAPPGAGDYGWWAAGQSYKVSFHDGFTFYPYLGPRHPEHLPVRWTTEAITVGDVAVADLARPAEHRRAAWRYEYVWPGVTEAYDVRAEGVEQSFVIQERPPLPGDLVVTGRVQTPLLAPVQPAAAHGPLAFADASGTARVRYGAAFAVDACGRREPIATSCDGERVRLTVARDWLARAVFPVTIDPLTTAHVIANGVPDDLAIGREDESFTSNVILFYGRQFTANDFDLIAVICNDDFFNAALAFVELSGAWSGAPDVTFAGGADRWVLAHTHKATAEAPARVRLYLHDKGNRVFNSGPLVEVPAGAAAETHHGSAVGGSDAGTQVLLAYEADPDSVLGGATDVWAAVADAATGAIGPRARINPASVWWAFDVDVSYTSSASDPSWLLAYAGISGDLPNLTQATYVTRIEPGNLGTTTSFAVGTSMRRPHVDGRNGRYLIAMDYLVPFPTIYTRRIDWPQAAEVPTLGTLRLLPTATVATALGVAYDYNSSSHWCLAYVEGGVTNSARACRLGSSGAVTEAVVLADPTGRATDHRASSVTYNSDAREFQILYQDGVEATATVAARRLQYSPDAINVPYGTGCNDAGVTVAASPPYAGSEFFTVSLAGLPDGTGCVLMLALAPAATPIRGNHGCFLNVSTAAGEFVTMLSAVTARTAAVRYALADDPLFQQDLFGQWLWLTSPNRLGVSAGLRMQVR